MSNDRNGGYDTTRHGWDNESDGLYALPGSALRGSVRLNDEWRYIAQSGFDDVALSDYDGDGLQDLLCGGYGGASLLPYDDILP